MKATKHHKLVAVGNRFQSNLEKLQIFCTLRANNKVLSIYNDKRLKPIFVIISTFYIIEILRVETTL